VTRPDGNRAPTINDVAARAGVSISTVSRVMRQGGDVSDSTRERVQRVVDELGYRPSAIARALVSGETRVLALLVSDLSNPFYPQLAKAAERSISSATPDELSSQTGDPPSSHAVMSSRTTSTVPWR
jgi:DNA-binding LacI/PurR family transcriptional regulator